MGGEPWGWDPPKIAQITDYQFWHVYYLPALKRKQALEKDMKTMTPQQQTTQQQGPQDVRELGNTKEDVVKFYRDEMGLDEATARAMVNEQWKD